MKVLQISGEFPPMRGGIGDYTARLATAVTERGHEVGVLTSSRAAGVRLPGVSVHPVIEQWGLSSWPSLAEIARHYDLIHLEYQAGAFGMGLAPQFMLDAMRLLVHTPSITTFHDLKVPYLFPKAGKLREWSVRHLARSSSGVVTTNPEDRKCLERLGIRRLWEIPIAPLLPLETATDWDREAWRERWKVGGEHKLIVHFGFINRNKGVENLLRAYDGLLRAGQPYRLLMAGDPVGASDASNRQYLSEIEALAQELNLDEPWLQWTGDLSAQELVHAVEAADLIVLPYRNGASLRRSTLITALSLGRPVVTTEPEIPIPFLRQGENIAYARRDNSADLAREIALLLRYPPSLKRLERGALDLRRYFDWDQIAEQYIEVYHTVATKS